MRRSYVTLVNDPQYIPGTKVLAHSLSRTGTAIPLVIMTSDLAEDKMDDLRGIGATVLSADHIEVKTPALRHFPVRSKTFSKINAWLLQEYERCVFLDSDVLVLANIDYLFDYPEFAAVGTADYFNTGVFVFAPSRDTHRRLEAAVAAVCEDPTYSDDSEQEMLQRIFRNAFTPLPPAANFRPYHDRGLILNNLYRCAGSRSLLNVLYRHAAVHVVHYIGYPKPWEIYLERYARDPDEYTWTDEELEYAEWAFELWRDTWEDMIL